MLHTRICTNECTVKLNDLIGNLINESLKKICSAISDYVISTADKKILKFYVSHNNADILTNANEYIIRRRFFLKTIEDVNDRLLRNNAGFVFDVSDEFYDYFEEKIVDSITPTSKRTYKELLYQISLHRRYMPNNKQLVRLKGPNKDLHVFLL